jgi:dihydrofolate synthase / folylpolyglutamate synthase
MFDSYREATRFIETLGNLSLENDYMSGDSDPGVFLKRTRYFLGLLGNPDRGLSFIHVTGTSGKGTVSHMLHNALYMEGKKVGLFTSPAVQVGIERISFNGKYIGPEEFAGIVEEITPAINKAYTDGPYGCPSYFEIIFAIALIYFKRKKCSDVVLEVGAGGKYDCTNVIQDTKVAIITSIDYDHTELLGKTLTKIAREKAGILKRGCVLFTAEPRPHLRLLFKQAALELNVPCHYVHGGEKPNEAIVQSVGRFLGLSDTHVLRAVNTTKVPARFEAVGNAPLVILDGAHNPKKMEYTVRKLCYLKFKKLHLLWACAEGKDYEEIARHIVPLAGTVTLTRSQVLQRKSAHPIMLREVARKFVGRKVPIYIDLHPVNALKNILRKAGKNDLVFVTGSFFLAGEIRRLWYSDEYILKNRTSF